MKRRRIQVGLVMDKAIKKILMVTFVLLLNSLLFANGQFIGVGSTSEQFDQFLYYFDNQVDDAKDRENLMTEFRIAREVQEIFWPLFALAYTIFIVLTLVAYLRFSKNTNEFYFKSKTLTLATVLSGWLYTINLIAQETLVESYPCFLRLWFANLVFPIYAISMLFRIVHFITFARTSLYKAEISNVITELTEKESNEVKFEGVSKGVIYKFGYFFRYIYNAKFPENLEDKRDELQFRINTNNFILDLFRNRNFYIVTTIISIAGIAMTIHNTTSGPYQMIPVSFSCRFSYNMYKLYHLVFVGILVSFYAVLVFACIGYKDAYGMQLELILIMVLTIASYVASMIYDYAATIEELVLFTGDLFHIIVYVIQYILIVFVPLLRLNRDWFLHLWRKDIKDEKKAAASKKEQFEGILSYPEGFLRLGKAANETFCPENVEFIKDYQVLKYMVCSYIFSAGEKFEKEGASHDKKANIEDQFEKKRHSIISMESTSSLEYQTDVDFYSLISGDIIPSLPGTIPEAVYSMNLMSDLNKINEAEGFTARTTSKLSRVPNKLVAKYEAFFKKFINENATLAVNVADRFFVPIKVQFNKKEYTLGIYDEVFDQVLKNLYENTYPVMLKKL
ncbi:hypothetical protein AX774_g3876 [Zancudomyces culisetae]|uniref:RGS domain-containing protein n=1 Tax=Zancudomyces culisetae TaxID=1213189 RepID=A0A1R1PNU5_ZANCU|nr:hypothetical protein AX774_g3876 [Zancudomyces culisetae]|eukprot:OMH82637.1 hypothetical protein AX774_g3876 [Zancudomyces culisetae]